MNSSAHVYIIAEAGVNHNGSLETAKQLVDAAVQSGADAVKFQTFKAENLVSKQAPKACYQMKTTAADESQYEMLRKLELDERAHLTLVEYCQKRGIHFLSTPFDIESIRLLCEVLNISKIKFSSGDLTNEPLLFKAASYRRPLILSTGMSTLSEIERALSVLAFGYCCPGEHPSVTGFEQVYSSQEGQSALKQYVTLLHCTTEYPAPLNEVNLYAMDTMRTAFGLPVGYSDHTVGTAVSVAAAARGAVIIEKHLTLDKRMPGPDHKASLEPQEFTELIAGIRMVEQALGNPLKLVGTSEAKNKYVARKSIAAASRIRKGDIFSEFNLSVIRPGSGLSPEWYWWLLGRKADKDYEKDELIQL